MTATTMTGLACGLLTAAILVLGRGSDGRLHSADIGFGALLLSAAVNLIVAAARRP